MQCPVSQPDGNDFDAILNAMTKVQITFKLARPLNEPDLVSISRMHSVYGFMMVRWKPESNELFVEYDASRLSPKEIRASLQEHGLPLTLPEPPREPLTNQTIAG